MKPFAMLFIAGVMSVIGIQSSIAEGDPRPAYLREAQLQKYKGCKYTDEMGKYLYQCIVKGGGFGAHWCYDESLEVFCPKPESAQSAVKPAPQ